MDSTKSIQHLKYQSLTPHTDSDIYASSFNFQISSFCLLIFVPQFEDFVTKSNQLRAAESYVICMYFLKKNFRCLMLC